MDAFGSFFQGGRLATLALGFGARRMCTQCAFRVLVDYSRSVSLSCVLTNSDHFETSCDPTHKISPIALSADTCTYSGGDSSSNSTQSNHPFNTTEGDSPTNGRLGQVVTLLSQKKSDPNRSCQTDPNYLNLSNKETWKRDHRNVQKFLRKLHIQFGKPGNGRLRNSFSSRVGVTNWGV